MSTAGGTTKGAHRRASILDHAARILIERGHADLSVRSVATAAGISLSNLQYYFPTRADLVTALLDRHLTDALDRVHTPLTGPIDLKAALDLLLAEQSDRDIAVVFMELWAMAAHDPKVAGAVRTFYDHYVDTVAGVLHSLAPALPATAVSARARVFVGLLEGMSLMRSGLVADADDRSDALLRRIATALLTGDDPTPG